MLNAIFMLLLIISGLSMQYSGRNATLIPFPVAVRMHNISGIMLTAGYLLFTMLSMKYVFDLKEEDR